MRFELWSVDTEEKDLEAALAEPARFPGEVKWLRSAEDLPAFLKSLRVEEGAPIPIHALVDGGGRLRCVRVGKVKEDSYGSVRAMLEGG